MATGASATSRAMASPVLVLRDQELGCELLHVP